MGEPSAIAMPSSPRSLVEFTFTSSAKVGLSVRPRTRRTRPGDFSTPGSRCPARTPSWSARCRPVPDSTPVVKPAGVVCARRRWRGASEQGKASRARPRGEGRMVSRSSEGEGASGRGLKGSCFRSLQPDARHPTASGSAPGRRITLRPGRNQSAEGRAYDPPAGPPSRTRRIVGSHHPDAPAALRTDPPRGVGRAGAGGRGLPPPLRCAARCLAAPAAERTSRPPGTADRPPPCARSNARTRASM